MELLLILHPTNQVLITHGVCVLQQTHILPAGMP